MSNVVQLDTSVNVESKLDPNGATGLARITSPLLWKLMLPTDLGVGPMIIHWIRSPKRDVYTAI